MPPVRALDRLTWPAGVQSCACVDPLTHTLAGVALARAIDRREGAAAAVSVWTAIAASHLPDADSLAPFFTGDQRMPASTFQPR